MKTIVILSALEKERQALLIHLHDHKVEKHPQTGTDYYVGRLNINNTFFKLVLGKTDQTNVNAAVETERAINHYSPSLILFVGVAGGLKDVKVGDIVIGQDVYGYERGKADVEKKVKKNIQVYKPRAKFGASSYALERAASNYSNSEAWKIISTPIVNKEFHNKINVVTGTIAAGEKVNASLDSDLSKFLKQHCSHALAIEMEGLGFLESCRAYPQIQSLLIRSISDLVTNKTDSDEKGSQEYASKTAAAFTFGFLETLHIKTEFPDKNILLDILCKLYPEGLKDNRIWTRAGGDLSRLNIHGSGFVQWFDAVELIENGGAGNVEFQSLIDTIKSDFPKNEFLKNLVIP